MKALSIRQPWAWLIVNGHKPVENRTWSTGHRGSTLIQAALGMSLDEYNDCLAFIRSRASIAHIADLVPLPSDLDRGGIVGQARLVDCVKSHDSAFFTGPFGFVMCDPKVLPFRPWRGQLQFFELPDESPEPAPQTGLF